MHIISVICIAGTWKSTTDIYTICKKIHYDLFGILHWTTKISFSCVILNMQAGTDTDISNLL